MGASGISKKWKISDANRLGLTPEFKMYDKKWINYQNKPFKSEENRSTIN